MRVLNNSRSAQIYADLRQTLEPLEVGEKLPTVRAMCERYSASPGTVQTAMSMLARAGLVVAKTGDGTYKADSSPPGAQHDTPLHSTPDFAWQSVALGSSPLADEALSKDHFSVRPDLIPFTNGYLEESFQPLERLARASARALKRPQVWQRLPPEGLEDLRAHFARALGGDFRAQDALIVSGGQAALSSIFRALVAPGQPILLESPTYFGAIAVARAASLRPVPVPVDGEGIRPDLLEQALKLSGAKVLYLQPRFHNPTGATLKPSRREQVLELARKHGVFIVEDDYARDLDFEGAALPPMVLGAPERIIYIRSITKTTVPGLRIAAILAKGPVLGRLRAMRALDDMFVTGLSQEIALELLTSSSWPAHLKTLRAGLKARRDLLVSSVRQHLPSLSLSSVPQGGFSLWCGLPEGMGDLEYVEKAARAGVALGGGSRYFPAEPGGSFVRLTYSGVSQEALLEGVSRLARVTMNS